MENGIEDDYQDMEPAMPRHDLDDNFFQMEDMLIPGMSYTKYLHVCYLFFEWGAIPNCLFRKFFYNFILSCIFH